MTAPGAAAPRLGTSQPVVAGIVSAVVGFAGAAAVVLAGLRAVGATEAEAASGLLILCVTMGVLAIVLARHFRQPLVIAWSTPGAALLIAAGPVDGGWSAAVGAFLLAGALTVVAGAWRPVTRLVEAIPGPIASALLAGVLLSVCVAPFQSLQADPWLTVPVIGTWLVLLRLARRWAVPAALAAAVVALGVDGRFAGGALGDPWPTLALTAPSFHLGTLLGVGVPLFLVTMASQNLAGLGVLRLHGYDPPLRPVLLSTGATSMLGAPLGGHGVNLAAITAALVAGPEGGPDPGRRWLGAVSAGASYIVIGAAAGIFAAVVAASPPLLIEAVAGLALLGALAGALTAATSDTTRLEPAVLTFAVTASGLTVAGISAPFWGLVAGLVYDRMRPHPAR